MKRAVLLAAIGAAAGVLIGAPMGVVGYGSGWGGAIIFGPIGAVIGLLSGLAIRPR